MDGHRENKGGLAADLAGFGRIYVGFFTHVMGYSKVKEKLRAWPEVKGGVGIMGQFHFVKGSNFLHPEAFEGKLKEGFTVNENQIAAQVSAEHIRNVMDNYLALNME